MYRFQRDFLLFCHYFILFLDLALGNVETQCDGMKWVNTFKNNVSVIMICKE